MWSHIKPFECKVCKKRFSENRYFEEHKLNHKKLNPFSCEKCPKAFKRFTSLGRHMITVHSEVRNFPCKQCKYKGKTGDDLTRIFIETTSSTSRQLKRLPMQDMP